MTQSEETALMALQVWQVLICHASRRQTLTYGHLATAIGRPGAHRGLGPHLDRVNDYCSRYGFPRFTTLVVRQDTGRPSPDFDMDLDAVRERVFAFNWFAVRPPTLSVLI